MAELAREAAQEGDHSGQAFWRMAGAQVLVRRGATDEAIALAREATAIISETQELLTLPDLLLRRADVLRLAGRPDEAADTLREAIELYERKGALAGVRQAEERLAALVAP